MSMFYAAFPDPVRAQQLMRDLLNDGIDLDDISLVTPGTTNIEASAPPSTGDATFFVGRDDDPSHSIVDMRSPDADFMAAELSLVGAGVSTSDEGRNVEHIDQMDDSQSAAEDSLWPREEVSRSRHEFDDLDRAVRTGFPSPVTPLDNEIASTTEPDRSFEAIAVPGVGIVMGGGDLATAAFDWAGKNGEPDASSFLTYLQDEGVPPREANELLVHYANGSSILSVSLSPAIDDAALEELAERHGAVTTGWFGAPRF